MRSILQRSEPRPMINSVPPRNGEGDRPKGGGGAGAGLFDADRAGNTSRAPPPCFAWSPSPCRGGSATIRSPPRLVPQRAPPAHRLLPPGKDRLADQIMATVEFCALPGRRDGNDILDW